MEARAGIEPANRGFAVPGLTTWLPRRSPKPLLSIDFAPLEQAKSPFAYFTNYENRTLVLSLTFKLCTCVRAKPSECHYRNGR